MLLKVSDVVLLILLIFYIIYMELGISDISFHSVLVLVQWFGSRKKSGKIDELPLND